MKFRIDDEVLEGDMTIKMIEDKNTQELIAKCTLILTKFVLSFEKLSCDIISINQLDIDEVIIGTREIGVIYTLTSRDFLFNNKNIDSMIERNIQEILELREGEQNESQTVS